MNKSETRNKTFDVMKGLGIILMVTGHTLGPESPLHNYIYAFHMPLFFLISGYFAKEFSPRNIFISLYKRLIYPFLFICFNVELIKALHYYYNFHSFYLDIDGIIHGIGPGWFLLALFWGRIIFNYIIIHFRHQYILASFVISSIPTLLQFACPIIIPFCVLQGLSSIFFIAIGYYTKQNNMLELMRNHLDLCIITSLILWVNTGYNGEIEMSSSYFKLWIIDYLGAIGGTILCYFFSKIIVNHTPRLTTILTTISFYSLAIYSFHSIDFCIPIWHQLLFFVNKEYMPEAVLFVRIVLFYPIIILTTHIPILYNLFICKNKVSINNNKR